MPTVSGRRKQMRRILSSLIAIVATLLVACSSASSGASSALPDAGKEDCAPTWRTYDTTRKCVGEPTTLTGLCQSPGPSTCKSIYYLCAISPDHQFYWSSVSCNTAPHGDGWTFAGDAALLKLPLASDADQALCPSGQRPDCS